MDPAPEELQFEKADVSETQPLACHVCQTPLHDVYFEVDAQASCEKCRYELEDWRNRGSGAGRFVRAVFGGGFGGLVGAGLYYAVLALTGYEVGLVAIVVGFLVGFGVRWGSRARGGWPYQVLAVGLTYVAIVSTYVPFVIEEIRKMEAAEVQEAADAAPAGEAAPESPVTATEANLDTPAPAMSAEATATVPVEEEITLGQALFGLAIFGLFILAIPFLGGFENILGLLIIGFGLYQAWRINAYQPMVIEGPFQVGKAPGGSATPLAEPAGT